MHQDDSIPTRSTGGLCSHIWGDAKTRAYRLSTYDSREGDWGIEGNRGIEGVFDLPIYNFTTTSLAFGVSSICSYLTLGKQGLLQVVNLLADPVSVISYILFNTHQNRRQHTHYTEENFYGMDGGFRPRQV
jgi:hypothetical protein